MLKKSGGTASRKKPYRNLPTIKGLITDFTDRKLLSIPGISRHLPDEQYLQLERMNFQRNIDSYEISKLRLEKQNLARRLTRAERELTSCETKVSDY